MNAVHMLGAGTLEEQNSALPPGLFGRFATNPCENSARLVLVLADDLQTARELVMNSTGRRVA